MKQKLVVVKQSDVKDCGPTCLQSIIRFYGGYVSLERIRLDCCTSVKGTTVYHLVNAAKKYGFNALAKKYLDKNIENLILPVIVHVHYTNGLDHFMCLYHMSQNEVILMDPAKGKVKMSTDDFWQIFTGVVIELSPKSNLVHYGQQNTLWNSFSKIIINNKKIVFNLLLSTTLLVVLTIGYSFYLKINYELFNGQKRISMSIILFFGFVLLLKTTIKYLKNYFENDLNKRIDNSLVNEFLQHVFNLPLKVINSKSTGEIVTRINELYNFKDLCSQIFIDLLVESVLGCGALVILLMINVHMTLILLVFLGFYIFLSIGVNAYIYQRVSQNIDFQTSFNATLIENIHMINSYKYLNLEMIAKQRNEKYFSKLIEDNFDVNNKFNIIDSVKNWLIEMGAFILNTFGFYLIYKAEFTLIDLVLFNTIMVYFIEPIKTTSNLLPRINYLRASYTKICDFLDIDEEQLGEITDFINGDIIFDNVTFSYNQYLPILKEVSFKVLQGEKVLLKGKSGCGKSTICALLERIYDPSNGEILIAGKRISDYSIKTIRENITYVSQKEGLITGTIRDNILLGGNDYNLSLVNKICLIDKIANKKQFGYESGIDSNYSDLSGGEKQRIILARALLKNSNIIILDEALSEVDIQTEEQIINNLVTYFPHKTIIYISHKNHNNLFDRIIDFEEVNKIINYPL